MPRPGPRREFIGIRLAADELDAIRDVAERETGGNLSEMIRVLIAEALAARGAQSSEEWAE